MKHRALFNNKRQKRKKKKPDQREKNKNRKANPAGPRKNPIETDYPTYAEGFPQKDMRKKHRG